MGLTLGSTKGTGKLKKIIANLLSRIVDAWSATPTHDNIPSEKLVKDSLNLKADITPANGATSALRALFIARGIDPYNGAAACVYNVDGTYSMNGLTDITEAEMTKIYLYSSNLYTRYLTSLGQYKNVRTLYQLTLNASGYDCTEMFRYNTFILIFNATYYSSGIPGVIITTAFRMFEGCTNLHTTKDFRLDRITNAADAVDMYKGCAALVNTKLWGLKVNFSYANSPLLSLASLQYLVTNRANGTSRITITVHADVWAKLNDSVNYPEWNALLAEAGANFIDFAMA